MPFWASACCRHTKAAPPSREGKAGLRRKREYYRTTVRFSGGHTSTADSASTGQTEEDPCGPSARAVVCSGITGAVDDGVGLGDDDGCSHKIASCPLTFSGVGWYPLGQAGPGLPGAPLAPEAPGAPGLPGGP